MPDWFEPRTGKIAWDVPEGEPSPFERPAEERPSSDYWLNLEADARKTASRVSNPHEWLKLADYYHEMAVSATERELSAKPL